MQSNYLKPTFIATLLLCSISIFAKEVPRSVDASNFDIAGVKLGMNATDSFKALQENLKVTKDKINIDSISRATGKPPKSLQVYIGKTTYSIFFGENIYDDKSPTIVTAIQVSMPQQNRESLKEAAIEKYGRSSGGSNALMADAVWCKDPGKDDYFTCSRFKGPVLKLTGAGLWFSDTSYDTDYIKYQEIKNRKNKPKL
ncbi:MAG: hypothetical protein L3J75_15935 [Methylococcaceae bacterium]|nr:hypothetical protein [Methylococcaceae bacterium]